ncbi:MAG: response regulator, partial [Lachnospiraceae bacterium]|nr:response regulator [Lachnospiraceae bacterium]
LPVEETPEGVVIYEGIRNITNEKRTSEALEDIEYRYKQASEQINIYNWEYVVDTKEMRPCYRCMRDLGLPAVVENYPEPAIEMGIFPADYADMYRDMMRKIDEGAPELEADIPLTVGRVPFRVKYTTEFDEKGNPVRAFGSATLISETELGHIKLDNQIIATLSEMYRCIYLADFVSDTLKIVKQDGILDLDENAGISEMLTYISSKLQDVSDEERSLFGRVRSIRSEAFGDGDQREFVYRDDEKNLWIRVGYHVLEKGNNTVDRLLVTASVIDDLTAQKMDDDRLIASQKKELEDRQKLLLKAITEAKRANKAKTEFFSNMSHDIRTPMSAITGFSRLAMEEIDNREALSDYLEKITAAGDHLLNLINDILDMSRIESGKMELVQAPVKMKALLLECADMVRVNIDEAGLKFDVDVDETGDDTVECDKLRVRQVVLNLLSNACKFTPKGGSVYLGGRLLSKGEKFTYEIKVRDTGIGMSEEFSKHIWDAYSREKTETVNGIQGTGLGMAIIRRIVNQMQGTVDLKTEQGKGTEFVVRLPFSPAKEEAGENAPDGEGNDALSRDYSGTTVLVVDDSDVNLMLADRVLKKYGFTVLTADNGVSAVEAVRKSDPGSIDLILMDVTMPVMDGLEAARRIRALPDPAHSGIPIIAATANAFESDVQKALDAGMNAHVPKPFLQEELISAIYETLKTGES